MIVLKQLFTKLFDLRALVAIALPSSAMAVTPDVLFEEKFDGRTSSFAKGLLSKKQVTLAKRKGPDGSNAIRVDYVGYQRGSERVVMAHRLKEKVKSATLTFDVMFEKDFQFVRGGKLHGLGPARSITGGKTRVPDGWSARIMFKKEGRISFYLYDQNPKLKWGYSKTSRQPVFAKGKWQTVTLQVVVNDAGKNNGSTIIFIDGRKVSEAKNVTFRGVDGPRTTITRFLFSTFHGGQSPPFAPVDDNKNFTTVSAYFDNFKVVEGIR